MSVGGIGLGVGTLAAWSRPGDTYRFYEINPAAERLAREYFTFLRDAEADVEVVLGDGRIALEEELAGTTSRPRFDVLIIDAFSGDAVPVHLLTLESLELYRRTLAPGGVLVLQITNRHVDLERVVRGLANAAGCRLCVWTKLRPRTAAVSVTRGCGSRPRGCRLRMAWA